MTALEALAQAMPPLPERLLAGVSGGADSVALLRMLLLAHRGELTAVHVDHGLRGEASEGDMQFVRSLCLELNVPLLTYRAEPPGHASEDWARQARYGFFREAMRETGAEAIALAHHRDDQAETLLLHLLRGSGMTGLGGMSAWTDVDGLKVVRPLLGFTRAQLRDALSEIGQSWREDASNADPRYLRNAVRTQLLPLMEQLAPGASGRIAHAAGVIGMEDEVLARQAEAFLKENAGPGWIRVKELLDAPEGLRPRILRAWWQKAGACAGSERTLSGEQTDALCKLLQSTPSRQCNLPGGWHGYRGWTCLHLTPPREEAAPQPVPIEPKTDAPARLQGITLTITPTRHAPGNGWSEQEIPRSMLAGCVLRCRETGDWIRPFGSSGRQSLQDYFVNRHVDAPFRSRVPLLCRGHEVLLVCGVSAGGIPPWQEDADNARLCWRGPMPWR